MLQSEGTDEYSIMADNVPVFTALLQLLSDRFLRVFMFNTGRQCRDTEKEYKITFESLEQDHLKYREQHI